MIKIMLSTYFEHDFQVRGGEFDRLKVIFAQMIPILFKKLNIKRKIHFDNFKSLWMSNFPLYLYW